MDLSGKIALVTGGASGIGLETVKALLKSGIKNVSILDICEEAGEKAVNDVNDEFGDGKAVFIKVDVTNDKEFDDAFMETKTKFGGLDIVVNNAGIFTHDYAKIIDVNLVGAARCIVLSIKHMGLNNGGKGGTVATTSSIFGLVPFVGTPFYNATKHGVLGLVRTFGQDFHFEKTGIKHVVLCPGRTDTNINNNPDRSGLMGEYYECVILEEFIKFPKQQPDVCGRAMAYIIKNGENGSIWRVESGDLFKVNIPSREEMSELIVQAI